MAIIECRECGHDLSTQAASCPNCGAPNAAAAQRARGRGSGAAAGTLIGIAALAVVAAAAWVAIQDNGQMADAFARWRAEHSAGRQRPAALDRAAGGSAPAAPATEPPPLYTTTAEQLYHDYSANAVALQNRIAGAPVRVTGSVTEIDEDPAGHPLVRLASGGAETTDMLLKDGQQAAAAQLVKGESVGIQCARVQRDPSRRPGSLQGSGCVLVLIEAVSAPAPPALAATGGAPAAVPRRGAPGKEEPKRTTHAPVHAATATAATAEEAAPAAVAASPRPAVLDLSGPATADDQGKASAASETLAAPATAFDAVSVAAAAAGPATVAASAAPPVAAAAKAPAPAAAPPLAAPPPDAAPAAPLASTAADSRPLPPDLASLDARDPAAAGKIASYCDSATAAASDRARAAANCRHDEEAAWRRLVVNDEFPGLDAATRSKCSEPPFPDSFVAQEACARYRLQGK